MITLEKLLNADFSKVGMWLSDEWQELYKFSVHDILDQLLQAKTAKVALHFSEHLGY